MMWRKRSVRIGAFAMAMALAAGVAVLIASRSEPVAKSLSLPDGSAIYFMSDTRIEPVSTYPNPREIHADGEAFFRVTAGDSPLLVKTRLMVLTVTGESAFKLTAYAKQAGEQVEVLYGHVSAAKSYPSKYSEPDILTTGQMSMVNRDIDLMEKERFEPAEVLAWSEQLISAAVKQREAEAK